jgi:hypothetical protein
MRLRIFEICSLRSTDGKSADLFPNCGVARRSRISIRSHVLYLEKISRAKGNVLSARDTSPEISPNLGLLLALLDFPGILLGNAVRQSV